MHVIFPGVEPRAATVPSPIAGASSVFSALVETGAYGHAEVPRRRTSLREIDVLLDETLAVASLLLLFAFVFGGWALFESIL